MRAFTIAAVIVGLLALFAAAADYAPEQQAIIDAWAANPDNTAQFQQYLETGDNRRPGGMRGLTLAQKAATISRSKGITMEAAYAQLADSAASIRAAGEASIAAARAKK
jgi:hypothetical protein